MQAAHPVLYQSKDLQSFLEASEDEWAMEMARAKHEGGANPAQKTLNNTLAKLKLFGQQTVAGGKHADEEEDPEYLKVCMQGLGIPGSPPLLPDAMLLRCCLLAPSVRAPTIIPDKRM